MTWVDVLVVLVVIGVVLFEARRDFGQTLLDTVALLLGLRAAVWLWPLATRALPLAASNSVNQGLWLLLSFLLCAGAGLCLAAFIHHATRWTLESFDPVFGFVFGMTSAVILAHVLVKSIALFYTTKQGLPHSIVDSALGQELLTFRSYHHLMEFLGQFPRRV